MREGKKMESTGKVTDRRGFFKQFFVDTICLVDECMGRPQMRLSDLDQAPEALMRTLAPVFNPKRPCTIQGNGILSVKGDHGQDEPLCEIDEVDAAVFHCFGTAMTVGEISGVIEKRYDLENQTAYRRVRTLFLFLAKRMICLPENPCDENE